MVIFGAVYQQANSQITLSKDTISIIDVRTMRQSKTNDKLPDMITFDLAKLKKIVDVLSAAGENEIQFQFNTISEGQLSHFASKYASIDEEAKQDLLNRPTLILRAPKRLFLPVAFNRTTEQAKLADDQNFVYFDIGVICPPPTSCN